MSYLEEKEEGKSPDKLWQNVSDAEKVRNFVTLEALDSTLYICLKREIYRQSRIYKYSQNICKKRINDTKTKTMYPNVTQWRKHE